MNARSCFFGLSPQYHWCAHNAFVDELENVLAFALAGATAGDPPGAPVVRSGEPGAAAVLAAGRDLPLHRLAWGRSGDKGNLANIGLIARRPEFVALLREQVTPHAVAAYFAHYLQAEVLRWELPGLNAFNFLLQDVLGGGGIASLRYDARGKSYAAILLDLPVRVPESMLPLVDED